MAATAFASLAPTITAAAMGLPARLPYASWTQPQQLVRPTLRSLPFAPLPPAARRSARCQARVSNDDLFFFRDPVDLADSISSQLKSDFDAIERQMDRNMEQIFDRVRQAEGRARQLVQRGSSDGASSSDGATTGSSSGSTSSSEGNTSREGWVERGDGTRVYERESRSEQQVAGGFSRSYSYEAVTVFGPQTPPLYAPQPPAALGSLQLLASFLVALLAGAYAAAAATFARNFHLTTFAPRWRWPLAAAWPVLAPFSPSFWRQFTVAVRGQQPSRQTAGGGDSGTAV